jgi:hypothetical protein
MALNPSSASERIKRSIQITQDLKEYPNQQSFFTISGF